MKTTEVFHCAECGKPVVLKSGAGRTREYVRGYMLPIPDDFEIPTCTSCGETYMTEELAAKLDALLRKEFLKVQAAHYRELVDLLVREHCVAQKDIVRACQVTQSYLSHVLAGKRQASATLTRLLEAFVACPSEFRRHLADRPWSSPKRSQLGRRPVSGAEWGAVVDLASVRRARWSYSDSDTKVANWNASEVGAA